MTLFFELIMKPMILRYDILLDFFIEDGSTRIHQHVAAVAVYCFRLRKCEADVFPVVVPCRKLVVHLREAQFEQTRFPKRPFFYRQAQPDRVSGQDPGFGIQGRFEDMISIPDQFSQFIKV